MSATPQSQKDLEELLSKTFGGNGPQINPIGFLEYLERIAQKDPWLSKKKPIAERNHRKSNASG